MKKTGIFLILCLLCGWNTAFAAKDKKPAVREQVLIYPSVDQHGDSLMLSGKVCMPLDQKPRGVILIPHYTITSLQESPSVKMTGESRIFMDEYVLLMPDYLGYGITGDRVHPYLAGDLTGHNCADMVLYAQKMADSLQIPIPMDSIYIVGYSQGGASAAWTLRVIEEHFADRIGVKGCFAGSGPYDVLVTFEEAVQTNKMTMPPLIALVFVGTDEAYDLHLDRATMFTPKMMHIYEKYIANKQYTQLQLFFKMMNMNLDHWLQPSVIDGTHPQVPLLREGLRRSGLVGEETCPEWKPKAPFYVFHSTQDNLVSIRCAEHLKRCIPENMPNVTYDFGKYGKHIQASSVFFRKVRAILDEQQAQKDN